MNKLTSKTNEKLKQIIELLKFISSTDDEEIIKSTIESIIEQIEEIIK